MAEGTGKTIGRLVNLVVLVAILIGAWYGYQKYIVAPGRELEAKRRVIAQLDEKKWDAALAELDELEKNDKFKSFVKEQRFVCYQAKANAASEQADQAQTQYVRAKDKDAAKAAQYQEEMKRLCQQCLEFLETAERYGKLVRRDIMNRSSAYSRLGDKEQARKWGAELQNYPN